MSGLENAAQPICPHCGYAHRDAWEIYFGPGIDGDADVTCGACGEEYFCSRDAIITYTSAKKEPAP